MQGHRPIDNVGEVEVHYIVSCYDIRVHLYKEISPSLKELLLTLEGIYLTADNWSTSIQCENVANQRLSFTLNFDYICDLNNGVLLCLRKLAFFSRTFNIK